MGVGVVVAGVVVIGVDSTGVDFTGVATTGVDFTGVATTGADFTGTLLSPSEGYYFVNNILTHPEAFVKRYSKILHNKFRRVANNFRNYKIYRQVGTRRYIIETHSVS